MRTGLAEKSNITADIISTDRPFSRVRLNRHKCTASIADFLACSDPLVARVYHRPTFRQTEQYQDVAFIALNFHRPHTIQREIKERRRDICHSPDDRQTLGLTELANHRNNKRHGQQTHRKQ